MKRKLAESFSRFQKLPPPEVSSGWKRVLERVRDYPEGMPEDIDVLPSQPEPRASNIRLQRLAWAGTLAVIVIAVAMFWPRNPSVAFRAGESIGFGESVYSNDNSTVTLTLEDGSRVEMKMRSELLFERANDGVVIHLKSGSVIISAAKQSTGRHLYVKTKDVLVAVVGTVFLVNAEEQGSRVAVIEGEVQVQHGTVAERLLPGDQVTTNPRMPSMPVVAEISWSQNAQAHLALLQQASTVVSTPRSTEPRFEAISLRPHGSDVAGRGSTGGAMSILPSGCGGNYPIQIDPGRIAVYGTTLHVLVTWAYGEGKFDYQSCRRLSALNLIAGGPGWGRTELWDLQATIPQDEQIYTQDQLIRGEAPRFRRMLRNLLAERFNLVIRSETKEVTAYALTAEKGAPRLTLRPEIDTEVRGMLTRQSPGIMPERGLFFVKDSPISDLIPLLEKDISALIVDQTGLTERYSFVIEYTPLDRLNSGGTPFAGPSLFSALPEQVGLKLEKTKKTTETWVIESADRASEN